MIDVQLERRAIEERLAVVDHALEQRTRFVLAQLELLRSPASLYANAPVIARRGFLDAFFSEVSVEVEDRTVTVDGELDEGVTALVDVRREQASNQKALHEIVEGDWPAGQRCCRPVV